MFRSLQSRLLILLVLFSVTPALVLGSGLSWYSSTSTRQRAEDTLNSISVEKEAQVKQWVISLQAILDYETQRGVENQYLPILLATESSSSVFQAAYNDQLRLFENTLQANPDFEELSLISLDGRIIISTRPVRQGETIQGDDLFNEGLKGPYLASPIFDQDVEQISIQLSQPVKDPSGSTIGVLAGRTNLIRLNKLLQEVIAIGETGETYLVSKDFLLLSQTRQAGFIAGKDYARTAGAEQVILTQQPGVSTYLNYAGIPVIGSYRWLPELQVALLIEQAQSEALSASILTTNLTIAAILISILLATLAAYLVSKNLTQPITQLTLAAERVTSSGLRQLTGSTTTLANTADIFTQIDTTRQDEIGALGKAFRTMTLELHDLIQTLEIRVEERTRLLQNRSDLLQIAAEVSRSVATILDTDQLIQQVVELIQQRFDLYYVGLFLTDPNREWAVLKAGTGRAGQTMLARGHRIQLGTGMIGWSIVNSQARVNLEANEDAIRMKTPELPETRSEAAIPLRSRGQVVGAITVQSRQPDAFDNETIAIFQTMADQIAVAIENTNLFAESQKALDRVEQAYGQMSQQAWLERISGQPILYRRDQSGSARLENIAEASAINDKLRAELNLDLKVRGQVIGRIRLSRGQRVGDTTASGVPSWNQAEISILNTILDQLGASLEAARLFEETQQQAQRERLVSEITSNMRATLDIDYVLQTAAREMLNALNLSEVEVRLGDGENQQPRVSKKQNSDNPDFRLMGKVYE